MNKSRSSMLLAVHVVCYSDLNWIQWFRMQFKHMLKLVKMMGFIIILSMTEEEMIREIAEPILEQLKKIEKQLGNHRMPQLPQIKFVKEGNMQDGPFMIGDIEVTDELLEKVEAYVQEEIEMMHQPTVLH